MDFIDKVDLIYQKFHPFKLSSLDKLFAFISQLLFGIYSILGIRKFNGLTVGYYEKEIGIIIFFNFRAEIG